MRRRTYLAAAVACATPLVAGCSDPDGGGDGADDGENDGGGGGGMYGRRSGARPAALGPERDA